MGGGGGGGKHRIKLNLNDHVRCHRHFHMTNVARNPDFVCSMRTTKAQINLACSLISTFGIRSGILVTLALCSISVFSLVSEAEETGLSLTWLQTLKTGFLATRPIIIWS